MRAARFLLVIVGVLAVLAAAAFFLRHQIAGGVIRSAMASAGLEDPNARVSALSLQKIELTGVSAGPNGGEGFVLDRIEAVYDWRALLSDRRVKTVSVGPGSVRLRVESDGTISAPGVSLKGGGEGGALPFDMLTLEDMTLVIDTDSGAARGALSGSYDVSAGGEASLTLESESLAYKETLIEAAILSADIRLEADGIARGEGEFRGDIVAKQAALRNVSLAFDGAGASWRDLVNGGQTPFAGEATIRLASADAAIAEIPALADLTEEQSALVFGGPITAFSAAGDLKAVYGADGVTIDVGDTPLVIRTDNGAALEFSPVENAPLYARKGGTAEAGFLFELSGAAVSALGTVSASDDGEAWTILAPIRVGEYRSPALSVDDASAMIRLRATDSRIDGDIAATTGLRALSIGRFRVADAPLVTEIAIAVDLEEKSTTLTLPDGRCIRSEKARFELEGQDTEAAFVSMRLCASAAPLAVIDWSGPLHTDFSGVIAADDIRYRLGETRIAGRPPRIEFTGDYDPALHQTLMSGKAAGGALAFNEFLNFSAVEGRFDFSLDSRMMRADGWLDSVRVIQNREPPLIAPVIGVGDISLDGKKAAFNYVLKTPEGVRLGEGDGEHHFDSASGSSTFVFDRLVFVKRGIQPETLAPVLRGVVDSATGAATGVATFTWASGELTSKAAVGFEDVTFAGPTRIVEETAKLNGEISFSQLWPVATDGVQTVSVESVSFYVPIPLKNGTISFDLPGDETLHVYKAEFPWFGGALGVYEADMSIAGDQATVPLRAENIDLEQILAFIDVEGLSGEGILSGVLPLVVEDGKAKIVGGVLESNGPGVVSYVGQAAEQASAAGEQPRTAFDLLRDLRYTALKVTVDGPLDGRLDFRMEFSGEGTLRRNQQDVRVPVKYNITLDAALLELLNQAALSRDISLQIERALSGED